MNKERYAIIDNKGIIYDGYTLEETQDFFENPGCDWEGDLLLVQILACRR
jgi:hypothetical protein